MAKAQNGDTVKVHYTGKFEDGAVFDSSEGGSPLEFKIGEGMVIPGFESAIVDMEKGESKTITILAAEAYGPRLEEMIIEVDRAEIPKDINLEVGGQLQMGNKEGQNFVVTVVKLSDDKVKLDGNHPMAGKDLTFDVML